MTKIVIVGAGYAGVLTAKKLEKKLKNHKDVTITILDKNPFHTMLTELHEVAAGRVEEESIKISLKRVFAGRMVKVVLDTAETIDFRAKTVHGRANSYAYDYLVIAAGSKPTFFGVKGAETFSHTLWSYEDAVHLHAHILDQFRKAVSTTDPIERQKLLSFYVVGAGFTGVEMIGELAEYVPMLCDRFEIARDEVKLFNIDILTRTVPILPEKLSTKVQGRLANMGVTVMLNTGVVSIGADYIEWKTGGKQTRSATSTVIWTAGIESANITTKAGETLENAGRGRIKTDSFLRAVEHPEIYVAGDNILYQPEGEDAPVPQMVENCEQSAHTIAHNIVASVTGRSEMHRYTPKFHGVMVSVGGRYGVARVGMPHFMINLPSFFAMLAKHFINVIYFIQVLGWNKIFSYLRHEFFTIRNCRSFLGGHFSNRTASFLLVPLRVWLGVVWVFEGVMKLVEGWMNTPMLAGFFGGANMWYNEILKKAGAPLVGGVYKAVATAADAVASATGAADAAAVNTGQTLFSINFAGLFNAIFVSGCDVGHAKLADYAFRLDVPFVNWMINTLILPNTRMQLFMQGFIVIAEILIGLALIGGLFTTPATAFSLVLQVMFVSTTGLYLSTFWMVFAAIAVLVGAGRILGLDYYVMPALKKQWKKVGFVRKWYLYHD